MKLNIIIAVLFLSACSSAEEPVKKPADRWYDDARVTAGAKVFQSNCAPCHGKQGEGAPNWRKTGPDGLLPAPPLNGTGHATHHPMSVLFKVIRLGGPAGQSNMPAWKDKLSDEEIVAAIAWFQSHWPDELYAAWDRKNPPK